MTSHVVSVTPAWSCDQCMSLMTERHVRHLPVVQDGRVVGVISIGDVVRAVLGEHKTTITTLEHYIMSGG
jgi:CBS domain-containing protein